MSRMTSIGLMTMVLALGVPFAADAEAPVPVAELLYARPFVLKHGYRSQWHKELPLVTTGYVVVLRVDPSLSEVPTTSAPVLMAGQQTVEILSEGQGVIVGIVPGEVDLKQTPLWFGPKGYADEMTAEMIDQSRAEARVAGIVPKTAKHVAHALAAGGKRLVVPDRSALLAHAMPLIASYHLDAGRADTAP